MLTTSARVCSAASMGVAFLLLSCSGGPAPHKPGTPGFYWQAAKETYAVGDYLKADEHLYQLVRGSSEYATRAQAWRLVVTGGLSSGYMELAESYEAGTRSNRNNPSPFRKLMLEYRTRANEQALQFAETFLSFQKSHKDPNVELGFGPPKGSSARVADLSRAADGVVLRPFEVDLAAQRALERGVLLAACLAVGAPEDVAKTQELLRAGSTQVPRATFIYAMADQLNNLAQLYTRAKADQPDRLQMFVNHAQDALKGIPETKETKQLVGKIEKALKASKRR